MSAVSVVSAGREAQALVVTDVTFADLDEADIAAYVASGEAMGKAGAYGIRHIRALRLQGWCGSSRRNSWT